MKKLSHYLLSPMMMEGQGRFSVASQQNSVCYLQSVDNNKFLGELVKCIQLS